MAALVEGQQYGLSSHDSNSINKTLIFVKLTDSALKSIEEYVHNKSNSILKPSIQFQSNNGVIRLPSNDTHNKSYGFTLSNVETDGPQGSFECLQQSKSKTLESLGCMLLKMHINANEDSYEKTRVKMAAVEKENKKFCTKEIKPSGSHVGRKVKVKRPLSSILSKPSSPPCAQAPKVAPKVYQNSTSTANNESSAATSLERHAPAAKSTKNPDLLKLSCRDRIIHLLALRPYKKPELLAKLLSEGIKEKEKRGISAILSQVAISKGNSYLLANHAWNEVQELWKFYSKDEAEAVRMKKHEVLHGTQENGRSTPASSPDQSPTQKRALEEWESSHQDQRSKKQRISHFNRADNVLTNSDSSRAAREDADLGLFGDKSDSSDKKKNNHLNEARTNLNALFQNHNASRKYLTSSSNGNCWNGDSDYNSNNNSDKLSPNRTAVVFPRVNMSNGDSKPEAQPRSSQGQKSSSHLDSEQKKSSDHVRNEDAADKKNGKPNFNSQGRYVHTETERNDYNGWSAERTLRLPDSSASRPQSPNSNSCPAAYCTNKQLTNGHHHNGLSTSGDASQEDSVPTNGYLSPQMHSYSQDGLYSVGYDFMDTSIENPEYLNEFVTITSRDQRAHYKAAFNAQYEEYKSLHDKLRTIVGKFAYLENKLNGCKPGTQEYFTIKGRIYKEYLRNRRDPSYADTKKKLSFLHGKLSHIKRLVMDYDRARAETNS